MAQNDSLPTTWHDDPDKNRSDKRPKTTRGHGLRIALIGGLILLALFAFGFIPRIFQNHKLDEDAGKQKNALPQVLVVKPRPMPDADLTLPGNTEAVHDTVIAARTTGYVSRLYVDIGSRVKTGQTLADIVAPDVDAQVLQGKQQTAQAVAVVRQGESDVSNRRATEIQSRSVVNQAEANVEQARAQLADAEAKRAQASAQESTAEAQLTQQKQNVDIKRAALNQAQTQLDLASVTLKRYQTLLKSGYVALQDVDQVQANFDSAQSAVHSAEADLRGAEANVSAYENLVQSARANVASFQAEVTASQKNVKAVLATVNSANASVTAARANIRSSQAVVQADEANVRASLANEQRLGVQRGFSRVVAPFDGVITSRNIDVGGLINGASGTSSSASSNATQGSASSASGSPNTVPSGGLFGIASTGTLRILVSVPDTYASLMRPGLKAELNLPKSRAHTYPAEVHYVAGAVDSVSRTLLTELYVPNRQGALLPGMYMEVHFDLPRTRGSLLVPSNTLMFDAQGTRVATVGRDNKIHMVAIHVGRDFGNEIEVLEGLTGRESVVTNPSDDLAEDMRVQAKQAPPPPGAGAQSGRTTADGVSTGTSNGANPGATPQNGQGIAPNGASAQGQSTGQQVPSNSQQSGPGTATNQPGMSPSGQPGASSPTTGNPGAAPNGPSGQPGANNGSTPTGSATGQIGGTPTQQGPTTPGG
jgi:multidrug efflux pump subunit AcrA (membrane-fusion protein)